MKWFDWFLIAWFLFGSVMLIAQVGKPRKPLEPQAAALSVVITAALIAGVLITRGAL